MQIWAKINMYSVIHLNVSNNNTNVRNFLGKCAHTSLWKYLFGASTKFKLQFWLEVWICKFGRSFVSWYSYKVNHSSNLEISSPYRKSRIPEIKTMMINQSHAKKSSSKNNKAHGIARKNYDEGLMMRSAWYVISYLIQAFWGLCRWFLKYNKCYNCLDMLHMVWRVL